MPRFTFSIGRTTPIRPVEATNTVFRGQGEDIHAGQFPPSFWHRAISCIPVQALAFPEFTTIACALDFFARGTLTFTGAAQPWLVVNIPATARRA